VETRLSLAPGQNGTKKLLATYGERLLRVRYRYDAARGVRHKTSPKPPCARGSRPRARSGAQNTGCGRSTGRPWWNSGCRAAWFRMSWPEIHPYTDIPAHMRISTLGQLHTQVYAFGVLRKSTKSS